MTHGLLAGSGAEHHQHQHPEQSAGAQRTERKPRLTLLLQPVERHPRKQHHIAERNQRPQPRQQPPVLRPARGKKQRGQQHDSHVPPAVEGVQQAHGFFLVVAGAGLHNGADQHLQQSSSDGVQNDGNQNTGKRVGHPVRQHGQQPQSRRGAAVSHQRGGTVADTVDQPGRKGIHQQLNQKIDGNQQSDA